MLWLFIGLFLFIAVHLVPSIVPLRATLTARLGEGYRGLYSLFAVVGLGLIIYGKSQAEFVHVYLPPQWGYSVTLALLFVSQLFFVAMYLPTNLKRFTAHPMLWGTAFWGGGHLFANGDLGSIALFGVFCSFAAFDVWSLNRRGALPAGKPVPAARDLLVLLLTTVSYVATMWLHPHFAGPALL